MTMLDRMRRHKGWLKWSLALVVLTFVVFYIPDFLQTDTGAAPSEVLAEVEGETITVREFQQRYFAQLQAYRNAYGSQLSEDLLRQLGIEQQILQQLVDEEAMVAEARRQGITVGDAEIRERILAIPAFQEDGRFVGEARYRQILQFQSPPLSTSEFESNLRRALLVEKLRNAVTAWMSVSDTEVAEEFRRRNERVQLDVVPLTPDAFRGQVQVSDADVTAHFEARQEAYRVGEKRRIRYGLVDVERVRQELTVPEADIEAMYQQNLAQYQTPEQVRASHILFRTDGEDDAAVRSTADAVLARARSGEDFAALARQFSQDESNRETGGDLDYFPRGVMVPEFEQTAFGLQPGEISDLVETSFGIHIIKLVDHRPATTTPLADVRDELEEQLRWQQAQQQAEELARSLESQMKTPEDLERLARERNLHVQESGFFLRDEPIDGLGPAPEVSAQAFQLPEGTVSPALRVAPGWVFVTVTGRQDPYVPTFSEVRDRVRDDLVHERAAELARTRADEIAASLKGARNFPVAVKQAGLELQTTELIPRESPIPEIGVSAEIDRVAFSLPVGAVSDPISTPHGTAIIRVAERDDVTDEDIAASRDELREELVNQRRDRFFSAYMLKAKQDLAIQIRQDTFARVVGATR